MHVWVFMALITTLVLRAGLRIHHCQRQCVGIHVVFSILLDLRAEESRVLRHVKPPRFGEASRKPNARSWDVVADMPTSCNGFNSTPCIARLLDFVDAFRRCE